MGYTQEAKSLVNPHGTGMGLRRSIAREPPHSSKKLPFLDIYILPLSVAQSQICCNGPAALAWDADLSGLLAVADFTGS